MSVLLLNLTLLRVGVFPQFERAVSARRHEDIAVLRQMPWRPDGRFVRGLRQEGVTVDRMVRAHVVQTETALKRGDYQLVDRDVLPVELDSADAVGHVGLPA